jgi:HSP20 family protein
MALMIRNPSQIEWATWFDRPFGDFPTAWSHLIDDTTVRIEQFENDGELVVRAELPGIDPEKDVEVTVSRGVLHIRAERRCETATDDNTGHRSEFRYGIRERSMRLPSGVTPDDVKATYKDGILEVRVPIDERSDSRRVPVVTPEA